MRRTTLTFTAISVVLLSSVLILTIKIPAKADAANAPSLIISQLKITSSSGQFIGLYNPTATSLDMGKYQLEYFNNHDLSKATSSKLITLSGVVPPHGHYMINDSAIRLCYQMTIDSVSLGLSSTSGFIQLLSQEQAKPGGPVQQVIQDYVGWSKTAASGAQTLPTNTTAFLKRQPFNNEYNPDIELPGTGAWLAVQPQSGDPCKLVTIATNASVSIGPLKLLAGTEPPAIIESANSSKAHYLFNNLGLMGPQITELLPNPTGTGNDSTDEYVELYNPNNVPFNLSGFSLQTGISRLRTFTFPNGVKLPAKSFTAFYSVDTKLSLSNTSSQAKLVDPLGNSISSSTLYEKAKDGNTWALANSKWYWTTAPTPAKSNIIREPITKSKSKSKSASSKKSLTTRPIKTLSTTDLAANAQSELTSVTPIHYWTLALVAGLAILYGAYEYRHDITNYIYRLRGNLGIGKSNRSKTSRWRKH